MSNSPMSVVILAAGKGTRMYSDLPKVLHSLAGKPMVQHVIDAAKELGASAVHLVYGHGGDLLRQTLHEDNLNWGPAGRTARHRPRHAAGGAVLQR